MPIIKSAKKRVLQAQKAYTKNKHYNSRMRTMIKNVLKTTDAEKAEKMLPETFSAIDVALKKKILHKNNAARKKALISKVVVQLKSGTAPQVQVKTTKAKIKTPAKVTVKAKTSKKVSNKANKTTKATPKKTTAKK